MSIFNSELCARCKGRGYCGKPCKILAKLNLQIKNIDSQNFQGSSPPAVFIGSKLQYPYVNVGVMSLPEPKENAWLYSSPNYWSQEGISSDKIIELRKSLINSRIRANVFDIKKANRILATIQEVGMASLQTDVQVSLKKKPYPSLRFDEHILPMGASAPLKDIKLVSNIKIPIEIEKIYYDTDMKASSAISLLYRKGYDEHSLSQILSIGATGLKKNRKLVPTRNSITAIDDTIGKLLLEKIKSHEKILSYQAYFGGHLGNYYLVLLFPEIFSYELFEIVFPKTTWNPLSSTEIMTDYENFNGRKDYAEETAGGYYAARLPLLQHLELIKKQASCLVIRFVLEEYDVPLGVWVCRNSMKKAMLSPKIEFETKKQLLSYAFDFAKQKLGFTLSSIFRESKLLKELSQPKLSLWI